MLAPNLVSAREFPEVIDSKIQLEVALGRIVGPFDTPPPPHPFGPIVGVPCWRSPPNFLRGNTE